MASYHIWKLPFLVTMRHAESFEITCHLSIYSHKWTSRFDNKLSVITNVIVIINGTYRMLSQMDCYHKCLLVVITQGNVIRYGMLSQVDLSWGILEMHRPIQHRSTQPTILLRRVGNWGATLLLGPRRGLIGWGHPSNECWMASPCGRAPQNHNLT